MAPTSPVKKPDGKHHQGNLQSKSRIPKKTKASLIQEVKQKASTPQENTAGPSTSKVLAAVQVAAAAPPIAPYQSTPKRPAVPVKPTRVTAIKPDHPKRLSPQTVKKRKAGSRIVRILPKRNNPSDAVFNSPQHITGKSPRSSQKNSKVLQPQFLDKRSPSTDLSSLHSPSPRRSTRTISVSSPKGSKASSPRTQRSSNVLLLKALHASTGGRRRQSITQHATFVRPGNKSRLSRSSGRRSSSLTSTAVDQAVVLRSASVSDDVAGPSKEKASLKSSSPGFPQNRAASETEDERNDENRSPRQSSLRESSRKSTSLQGSALLARNEAGSSSNTPIAYAINDTPGRPGTRGLNTPFRSQAPKSARRPSPVQRLVEHGVDHSTKEQRLLWDQQMKDWCHRPWKLCFMSALTNFEVLAPNLRTAYQNTLRQLISKSIPFNVQVILEPQHCFSRDPSSIDLVSLTINYSVPVEWNLRQSAAAARTSGDAALAAATSRHKKASKKKNGEPRKTEAAKSTTGTSKRKTLYKALLVRADMRDGEAKGAGVTWYPLYFYSGRVSIHYTVVGWLQDSFGSHVCLRSLRAPALLWAAGLWLQQPCGAARENDDQDQVELAYQLTGLSADGWQHSDRLQPCSLLVSDVSTLTLQMPVAEIRQIAKCIVPEESAEGGSVTEGERNLLHSVIQELAHYLTKLPLTALRLKAVNTACVSLTAAGEVKVLCKRHLKGVIDFLLELHKENSLLDQVMADNSQDLDSSLDSLDSVFLE